MTIPFACNDKIFLGEIDSPREFNKCVNNYDSFVK